VYAFDPPKIFLVVSFSPKSAVAPKTMFATPFKDRRYNYNDIRI